jgi:thiosulfate reductase cytochrome b subunit
MKSYGIKFSHIVTTFLLLACGVIFVWVAINFSHISARTSVYQKEMKTVTDQIDAIEKHLQKLKPDKSE